MTVDPVSSEAAWAEHYDDTYKDYENAVDEARKVIEDALAGSSIAVHQVTARAKSPDSVRAKIRYKRYDDPEAQMTDLLGVRVITTYEHGVGEAVDAIRDSFRIDEPNSIDKTSKLDQDRFGYRGVHLVAKIRTGSVGASRRILEAHSIEIQVRSVVEHAWAEIDHELRYKSGIEFPPELDRRFNAVAGTLEMVDREFSAIVTELISGVDRISNLLEEDDVRHRELDTLGLLAILQRRRPEAPKLGPGGVKLKLSAARDFVHFLGEVGITDVAALNEAILSQPVRNAVHDYAASRGIRPASVSASVILAIILGIRDTPYLTQTGLAKDAVLLAAIQTAEIE